MEIPSIRAISVTFTGGGTIDPSAAVGLKPGMAIADVGAGTGIYEPVFAKSVGAAGKVYAACSAIK